MSKKQLSNSNPKWYTNESELILSAVLLPIFALESPISQEKHYRFKTHTLSDQSTILFTKRTETVDSHKGQISFPGGIVESTDVDTIDTALRESEEEVGIPRSSIEILGSLTETRTYATPFKIVPHIGFVQANTPITPNPSEIDKIILVPIHHLLLAENHKIEFYEREGTRFPIKVFYFEENRIWGATARILDEFLTALQPL